MFYHLVHVLNFLRTDEQSLHLQYLIRQSYHLLINKNYNLHHQEQDKHFQIVTLGEDDGSHFLIGKNTYCSYYGNKHEFIHLLWEALSMFNNNVKEIEK